VTAFSLLVSVAVSAVRDIVKYSFPDFDVLEHISFILFFVVVPLTVLVVNVIVAREALRASNSVPARLEHDQSTSSSSVVPTVMLVTISLIYVLLCGTTAIMKSVWQWTMDYADLTDVTREVVTRVYGVTVQGHNLAYRNMRNCDPVR